MMERERLLRRSKRLMSKFGVYEKALITKRGFYFLGYGVKMHA